MSEHLAALARLIQLRSGISLSERQFVSLAAAVGRVAPGAELSAFAESVAGEGEDGGLLDRLIDEVTVNETFFLRERDQLGAIDWHALQVGARARGAPRVRVWSAACATGEEPYTLALLAGDALGWPDPPVEILGTDISPTALRLAARGRYRKRSMRHLEEAAIERHFERQPGSCTPKAHLRALVSFAPHNLAGTALPAQERAFDLVLCRNVLIYLSPEAVERALALVRRSLAPGGQLLLGAADRLAVPAGVDASRAGRHGPAPQRARRRPAAPSAGHRRARVSGRRRAADRQASAAQTVSSDAAGGGQALDPSLSAVLELADAGDLQGSAAAAAEIVAREPSNAEALFLLGLTELASGCAAEAVRSLRAALYVRPSFALAAFTLGRAHDALADPRGARRAYEQALRTFDPDEERQRALLAQIDLADLAGACRIRLAALTGGDGGA